MRALRMPWCVVVPLLLTTATSASTHSYPAFDPSNKQANAFDTANGCVTEVPYVNACRLEAEESITLDGRLDDPVWARAESAWGFRMWDPTRGGDASEETIFKVVYDDEAVYFGIACPESDANSISSQLCRRDHMVGSDILSLYLDTYHDYTTGYNFRVNPCGVQRDVYVYNDGHMDSSWNAVWSAETYVDENGWYAEMRIPFSCVRYRNGGDMTWGCNLYRFMHSRGEDTSWTSWDRETSGFVSRFGEIRGIRGVRSRRQLEFLPYVVHRTTDPSAAGDEDELDHFDNLGLDVRYGVTSDLTLNATFQPDFGQVEADPALLNLSPFETYYEERRPFFVEGSQFFQHQDFRMFYSRRIGTGDENSRIRTAGKLTGKTPSGVSIAGLYALTDVTGEGQAHNPFKSGEQTTQFLVGRVGKEFSDGAHRVNITQTAVLKPDERDELGSYATRDAYTTGVDFDLNFADRAFGITGSAVGSMVDRKASVEHPEYGHAPVYGTGGRLHLVKQSGTVQGGINGRWETDQLDLNDAGFLSANDEINMYGWLSYSHESTEDGALVQRGNFGANFWRNWLYGENVGYDLDSGEEVWSYGPGHPTGIGGEMNGWMQFGNFWSGWFGAGGDPYSSNKYLTRAYDGERGPLMQTPGGFWGWCGVATDGRKDVVFELNWNLNRNEAGGATDRIRFETYWTPTTRVNLGIELGYDTTHAMAGFVGNFASPGEGIGGVSYVFAELDRQTVDMEIRADVIFTRNLSLQLYAQPYLTIGEYSSPKRLAEPDSYEFEDPDGIPEFDSVSIGEYDFEYSAWNVNAVLRWEYRPGSTLYVVWKQGRSSYDDGFSHGSGFEPKLSAAEMFDSEPENTFLVKLAYWLPL
ncbi:carbohydrate binding family 9 domain-containing protein [bacterium]|nr:carbohydrate binding family 9 domain-containing protein [bacterium]